MNTKAETVNIYLAQLETFLHNYYLELGLILCIIAGAMTEFQCWAAGLSPIWGLLWGIPMAGIVLFYNKH